MEKIFSKKIPQYTRILRHVQQIVQFGNLSKWINLLQTEYSFYRGDILLKSKPYIIIIDTGNVCNLRCPLCPSGNGLLKSPKGFMPLSDFKKIIDKIKPYSIEVILHNWGEPLLNPDIFSMIRYATDKRLGTSISSNFNCIKENQITDLIDSGLTHLTVSLDAVSQETYKIYRRNGNIDHVLEKLQLLQTIKKQKRLKKPFVEWQFVVMKHNEQEVALAKQKAKELGVDSFRCIGAGLPFYEQENSKLADQWLSSNPSYNNCHPKHIDAKGYLYKQKCFYLHRSISIDKDGEVAPCCNVYNIEEKFGNILHEDFSNIWNNIFYQSARSLFTDKKHYNTVRTVCNQCKIFKKGGLKQ